MKVLKAGTKSGKWAARVICRECEAVLEIEKEDLYVINTAVAYAGETWEPEVVFNCAVCETRNYAKGNVPAGIRYRLIDEVRNKRR